jgi:hypothetical protein
MGNRHVVALTGAAGRLLRTPPERLAQVADVTRVGRDAKGELHHGGNPAAGSQLASELENLTRSAAIVAALFPLT